MSNTERAAGMASAVFGTEFAYELTDAGVTFTEQIDGEPVRRFILDGLGDHFSSDGQGDGDTEFLGYTLIEYVTMQRLRDAGYEVA